MANQKSNLMLVGTGLKPAFTTKQFRHAEVLRSHPAFTNAGTAITAGMIVEMMKIPRGTILQHGSWLYASALGADRTVKVGWLAYKEPDGTAVEADDDGLLAAADAATGLDHVKLAITEPMLFKGDAVLIATVSGGTFTQGQKLVLGLEHSQVQGF